MKLFLGLSLCLNLLLGVLLYFKREPQVGAVASAAVAKVKPGTKRRKSQHQVRTAATKRISGAMDKTEDESVNFDSPFLPASPHEVEELNSAAEKISLDKHEFLSSQLLLSAEQIDEMEGLKRRFHEAAGKIYNKGGVFGELSFADRRKLIDMEEKHLKDLARSIGPDNWERYQKFRKDYNLRLIEAQEHSGTEPTPFMLMDL